MIVPAYPRTTVLAYEGLVYTPPWGERERERERKKRERIQTERERE